MAPVPTSIGEATDRRTLAFLLSPPRPRSARFRARSVRERARNWGKSRSRVVTRGSLEIVVELPRRPLTCRSAFWLRPIPKLRTRVRFSSPAPFFRSRSIRFLAQIAKQEVQLLGIARPSRGAPNRLVGQSGRTECFGKRPIPSSASSATFAALGSADVDPALYV